MKTDVQTLIAALTSERDAIDRAIVALRHIRGGEPPTAVPEQAAARTRRAPRQRRPAAPDVRRAIVAQLTATPPDEQRPLAKRLARQHGLNPLSVATNWHAWAKTFARTNGAAHDEAPVATPDLVTQ